MQNQSIIHRILKLCLSGLFFILIDIGTTYAQANMIQAGPMPGFADLNFVKIWVQTKEAANVRIAYWPKGQAAMVRTTATVRTQAVNAYTAHLAADAIKPGNIYEYQVLVNDQPQTFSYPLEFQAPALWQYRTDPPNFSLALGSCAYFQDSACARPGEPYGGDYQIFTSIHNLRPDVMLWLGDNNYFTECDWTSRQGMLRRYSHSRAWPTLQPLLGSTHHFAVWDDHDYGPNDADGSFILKDTAREVFQLFWENPTYGISGNGGITSMFEWSDVQFFLLDNRTFRTANGRITGNCTVLGDAQIEWLINALKNSRAPFKLVAMGGQMLNPARMYETYENLCPAERKRILDAIVAERIPGVLFLDGDRHHTVLSMWKPEGFYPVYDLTVSPLTSKANAGDTNNTLEVPGTKVGKRNFAILKFEGPRTDRSLTISVYDANGAEQWIRTIRAKELTPN